MNGDRCGRCARIQGAIGLALIAPIAAAYVLFLVVYGLTRRRQARLAGDDPDQGSAWPLLAVFAVMLIIVLVLR